MQRNVDAAIDGNVIWLVNAQSDQLGTTLSLEHPVQAFVCTPSGHELSIALRMCHTSADGSRPSLSEAHIHI